MDNKEEMARALQLAIQEDGQALSYKIGNITLKLLNIQETIENTFNGAAAVETGYSAGKTVFGAVEDFSRGDKLCTGLCLVATACEGIAFTSRMTRLPYSTKVYFCAKTVSLGVMRFRNLCRNAKGEIFLC